MNFCRHYCLPSFLIFNFVVSFGLSHVFGGDGATTIAFTTVGRSRYAFDIFALPVDGRRNEFRITDGNSVNYNGQFPSSSSISIIPSLLKESDSGTPLIYVTERNRLPEIYLDVVYEVPDAHRIGSRSSLEVSKPNRFQALLVGDERRDGRVSMKDRPSLTGHNLVYVSTHENPRKPRASWAAVYSTHLVTGSTRRLSPQGVADFSPAVSPSGLWTAVASYGETGWDGDGEELRTDIYVFLTQDGSNRVKIIAHGGWPSWADDSTLYFHRRCEDGWWSVFRASFNLQDGELGPDSVLTQRVTPPGLHAFTPAASVANKSFIAVATRRPRCDNRHIELYDVVSNTFIELTRPISPNVHHLNPFVSPDSLLVGYHKCRRATIDNKDNDLILESLQSPLPSISLLRIDGSMPSFSPNGDRIAFVELPGLSVMNRDGSGVRKVFAGFAFATAWDWKREGIVYTSAGPDFATVAAEVDIIAINVDEENPSYKKLTLGDENNAFPSPSPDGKWIVFRSGRSGYKNLYIMDALEGEAGGLHRLTNGPWTDTMCNWSPNGDWIVFASDRENPGFLSFELFKIHPNGTGLQKVIQSGSNGLTNHPWFSPDGKYIVFTSDYGGVSAEPISTPHQFGPYAEIYVVKEDGSWIQRLTHNAYEDGTPTWGPKYTVPGDVQWPQARSKCSFEDCRWLNISTGKP